MKNIVSTLSRYMLTLCFSSILIFGGLTLYLMVRDYQKEVVEAETRIFGGIEDRLINEINRIKLSIKFTLAKNQ